MPFSKEQKVFYQLIHLLSTMDPQRKEDLPALPRPDTERNLIPFGIPPGSFSWDTSDPSSEALSSDCGLIFYFTSFGWWDITAQLTASGNQKPRGTFEIIWARGYLPGLHHRFSWGMFNKDTIGQPHSPTRNTFFFFPGHTAWHAGS